MADQAKTLKCKITDAKRISPYNFEYLVGVQFNDGEKTWVKAFKMDFGHLASFQEFTEALRFVDPNPETQQDLIEKKIGEEFEVEFVPQREN